MSAKIKVAIVGSGPAGLMCAHVLASSGFAVKIFEKRAGPGRKILIAGSSGLNISHETPLEEFVKKYSAPSGRFDSILKSFGPENWIQFVRDLGLEAFRGSSGRWFVKDMKGANLLHAWVESLKSLGAEFEFNSECTDFSQVQGGVRLTFSNSSSEVFHAVCFSLGGGSWEKSGQSVQWPAMFISKGIEFIPFESSNCGFEVKWSEEFLEEAEGKPLKEITLTTRRGSHFGELMITNYGIEGTPVYSVGECGEAWIDLKPAWNEEKMVTVLNSVKENFLPIRRAKKSLNLSPVALALLFHGAPEGALSSVELLAKRVKKCPILLEKRRPLDEAISASGGIAWNEVDDSLMLKKVPGVYVAGEMLDWDAPTGGFLIQGCVSQGNAVGKAIQRNLSIY